MGKKFMRRLLVLIAAMCMMITMAVPVLAEEDGETATVTGTTEDPANGILQVMLAYVDDGGNRTYYTGGTCFMINEEYVVTNKHVFDLDTVLSNGLTVRETMKNDYSLEALPQDNDSHIKLYVFANRDTNVEATVHENAQSDVLDFAALKLSEKIYGRQPLVLGDSDSINPQDTVFAMGFPEDSVQNKKFNTKEDVSISDGIISKVTVTGSVDIIEHTAPLNNGNSGGPLLNADNQVIGINEFIIDQKNYSIQINAVKEILDTYGIAYSTTAGGTDITPDDGEDDAVEPEGPDQALISSLQSEIDKAKAMDVSGYTDESVQVLNDTIGSAESVVSNPDATDAQIKAACDIASASPFIEAMQDGYSSHVEQGGTNFSGGQRQRLCIARALLKKPKILIMDDSTSAVDTATDAQIRKALREDVKDLTKIIISQRLSSVMDADQIIIMNNGHVEDVGTHPELLQRNADYRDLYETQTRGGNLDD